MHQAKFVNDIDYAGEICLLESSIERAQVQLSLAVEPAASINPFATSYYRIMLNTIGLEKVSKVRVYDLPGTILML